MLIAFIIAKNFFFELIRRKTLFVILFFAITLIMTSLILDTLSLEQGEKIIYDLGISAAAFFGIIATFFLSQAILASEIESRTMQFLLSKPVNRTQVIIGKFLGLIFLLLTIITGMGLLWFGLIIMKGSAIPTNAVLALVFIFFELIFLASVTIFFSTFTSPVISLLCGVMIFFSGHIIETVYRFGQNHSSNMIKKVTNIAHYIIPDLSQLNLKNHLGDEFPFEAGQVAVTTIWFLLWVTLFITLSIYIFQKKEV